MSLSYDNFPTVSFESRKSIFEVYHSLKWSYVLPVPPLANYEPASVDLYFQTQCIKLLFLYTYEFS